VLRLLYAAALLPLSLLAVLPAPDHLLWKVAIGVTEWGHVLAAAALLVLLPGWRRSVAGRTAAALGVLAACMALSPLARAVPVARALPHDLEAAFGAARPRSAPGAPARTAPLVAADLLRGVRSPPVRMRTLVYAHRPTGPLRLDLYEPRGPRRPAPAVLVIHGGAWRRGARDQLPELNRYLAARGYVVAAMEYRLAPVHRAPEQLRDVRDALAFLRGRAAALGIDPARVVLLGRSAGGQLALLAGYTAGAAAPVRGVVALYAPTDLRYGYAHPSDPDVIDSRAVLEAYLGGSPVEAGAEYDAASPVSHVGPATPPTLLLHGQRDELVSRVQSERLTSRLAAAGRPHLLLRLPWATHGCDFNFAGPCGQLATFAVERFLAAATVP
jgi:acetyl esterase/lipase